MKALLKEECAALHLGDTPQVADLGLQRLDVLQGLSLLLLFGQQGERAAAHVGGVQEGHLSLQLTFDLLAGVQEGLHVGRAQQLVALLVLQLLDPIPPAHVTASKSRVRASVCVCGCACVCVCVPSVPALDLPLPRLDLSVMMVSAPHQLLRHAADVVQLTGSTRQLGQKVLEQKPGLLLAPGPSMFKNSAAAVAVSGLGKKTFERKTLTKNLDLCMSVYISMFD